MNLALPLYAAAMTLAAPSLRRHLVKRAKRGKEIPARLDERRGIERAPRPQGKLIWLHAASVGETMSILPVIHEIGRLAPAVNVLLTTGTVTSAALFAQRAAELGPNVRHRFVPLDVPAWAANFLHHWRPDAAGFVESELWPNLLGIAHERGVKLMLVNARLSPRSLKAWSRLPGAARAVLSVISEVQAQSEADAARFRALGAANVTAPGNLKFAAPALPADAAELARLQALIGDHPVWLAASTHPGEEAIVAEAHTQMAARHPGLITLIAPRHPERGAALAAELAAPRRSQGADPAPGVYLVDTLGELGLFYRLAPVVLMGRSLIAPGGGQNPLEPARLGCAVLAGPYMDNFAEPVAMLHAAGAYATVANATATATAVSTLLEAPPPREAAIQAASRYADLPRQTARALLALAGAAV